MAGCCLACALPSILPPVSRNDVAVAAPVPAPPRFDRRLATPAPGHRLIPVLVAWDSSAGISRVSVTTHPGMNFLWIRHPRLTFYFEAIGPEVTAPPATVEFLFHSQSPQDIVDNRLSFTCDMGTRRAEIAPAFSEKPDILTINQLLVYRLSVAEFDTLASCAELTVAVDRIHVDFEPEQVAALRDLARRMYPPGGTNRSGRP